MSDALEQEFDDFRAAPVAPGADPAVRRARRDRRVLPDHAVRLALHRPALVLLGRLHRRLRQDAVDPGRAVLRLRPADGRQRRRQHGGRLPVAPVPPARLARADRPRPLPRRGGPDPHAAAGLGGRRDRPLRRRRGQRQVADLPALGQPRAVPLRRPLLPQGRRLLRLHPALAALPGRVRDRRSGALGDHLPRRPLPVRRDPAPGRHRPDVEHRHHPALGPGRPRPAGQGGRLLPRPLRPGHRRRVRWSPAWATPTSTRCCRPATS